jgi:hypothetical protein
MASGTLIAESLRVGAVLDGPPPTVGSIRRMEAGLSDEQRAAGRAAAEEHGRARGVPDEQLDWP